MGCTVEVDLEWECAEGDGSWRILRMRRWRSAVGRRAVVADENWEDVSLCQSVNAVWERERRLDARSARPFLYPSTHTLVLSFPLKHNRDGKMK
jgi:hypothetical protein